MTEEADSSVKSSEPDHKTGKRSEHRNKKAVREARKTKRQKSWGWRIFRIVFHILWLPVLLAGALAAGLFIGYTVLGGGSPGEVFSRDLWQHLYDIIYAEG